MSAPRKRKRGPAFTLAATLRLLAPVWLYLLLVAAASLLPPGSVRLWGVNVPAWLPAEVWFPVLALPFLLLVPAVRERIASWQLPQDGTGGGRPDAIRFALFGGMLLALILLLQIPYPFLGDGVVYRSEVFRLLNDPQWESALVKPTSVLTGALIEAVAWTLKHDHTDTPYFVLCLVGLISFVLLALRLQRRETLLARLLVAAPALLTAGVLLYFTYVELYVLQYTFGALYLVSVFGWQRRSHGVWLPVALLLLSMGFGLSSVILLPSLLLLLVLGSRPSLLATGRRRAGLLAFLAVGGVVLLLLIHAFADMGYAGQFIMPFSPPATDPAVDSSYSTYTVFSSAHLLDILNVLLLNAGPFLLVLLFVPGRAGWRRLLADDAGFVLMAASLGGALQLVFGASTFGLARDWDLALLPVLPFSMLAVRAILLHPVPGERALLAVGSIAAVTATTALWIAVNVTPASASRYEHLLDTERPYDGAKWLREGYRTLAQYHGLERNDQDAERVLVTMLDLGFLKLQTYEAYFLHVLRLGQTREGMRAAAWLMDRMANDRATALPPDHWKYVSRAALHSKLASVIIETAMTMGRESLVAEALQRYEPLLTEWKEAALLRALVSTSLPAEQRYAMVRDMEFTGETDPLLYPYRANLAQLAGMCDTAAYYYSAMLERDAHAYPKGYLGLANVQLTCMHDTAAALRTLDALDENCKLAHEERGIAVELRRRLGTAP